MVNCPGGRFALDAHVPVLASPHDSVFVLRVNLGLSYVMGKAQFWSLKMNPVDLKQGN